MATAAAASSSSSSSSSAAKPFPHNLAFPQALYPATNANNEKTNQKIQELIDANKMTGNIIFAVADLSLLDVIPLSQKITRVIFFDRSEIVQTFWDKVGKSLSQHTTRQGFINWLKTDLKKNDKYYQCGMSYKTHTNLITRNLDREIQKKDGWLHTDEAFKTVRDLLATKNGFQFHLLNFCNIKALLTVILSLPQRSLAIVYLSNILSSCESPDEYLSFYKGARHLQKHSPDAILVESNLHELVNMQFVYFPLSAHLPQASFQKMRERDIPPPDVLKILLKEGANPKRTTEEGNNPLHSCEDGEEVVTFLLEQGVPIDGKNKAGQTPVNHAAFHGHLIRMEALLEAGADATIPDSDGDMVAHTLASLDNYEGLDILLADSDELASMPSGENGYYPVHLASKKLTFAVLMDHNVDLNAQDSLGNTPLLNAILNEDLPLINILRQLDKTDGYLKVTNKGGKTAQVLAMETLNLDLSQTPKKKNKEKQ